MLLLSKQDKVEQISVWEPLFSVLEMFFNVSCLIHALIFLQLPFSLLYLPFPLSSSTTGESIVEWADMCGSLMVCFVWSVILLLSVHHRHVGSESSAQTHQSATAPWGLTLRYCQGRMSISLVNQNFETNHWARDGRDNIFRAGNVFHHQFLR